MKSVCSTHTVSILRWLSVILLVMVLSLGATQPAFAQPHALGLERYVGPAGDDGISNDCSNPLTPCLTIQYAISKAAASDIIKVVTSTYTSTSTEVVLLNKNLTLLGGWDSAFTAQAGPSIIDGQNARRGIKVESGVTATVDHFTIQNGYDPAQGAGIFSQGTLTLNSSLVTNNLSLRYGGGIYMNNLATLTINGSTISNNTAGEIGWGGTEGGGGLQNYGGTVTINNSTFSGNTILGTFTGSAIETHGTMALNNSTISGNLAQEAIETPSGTLTIKNSTIAGNTFGGIQNSGATVTILNSILAQNTASGGSDCTGSIGSTGYNIIGDNTGCTFASTTGDQVGSAAAPINPRLGSLADNGGLTQTRALADTSPAVNAGSPEVPGGAELTACPATDQRGVARGPDQCDIGAYEGAVPLVLSIKRVDASPTSQPNVYFTVKFSSLVTGVDTVAPFTDFKLTTTGVTGAKVKEVTGSGSTYTVKVFTGTRNGTIRLDVKDWDTITNGLGVPLGGTGLKNGKFKGGEVYTLTKIPKPISPGGLIWDNTPTFKWSLVPQATQYSFQLYRGTALVYSKTISSGICGATNCTNTPTTVLAGAAYQWRVRAMTQGTWKPYSANKSFTVDKPKAGYFPGSYIDFYVAPDRAHVLNYSFYITVGAPCNKNYKITYLIPVSIVNRAFSFTGSYHANGVFASSTHASGNVQLSAYPIAGCGLVDTNLYAWAADWFSDAQPAIMLQGPVNPAIQPLEGSQQVVPAWVVDEEDPTLP